MNLTGCFIVVGLACLLAPLWIAWFRYGEDGPEALQRLFADLTLSEHLHLRVTVGFGALLALFGALRLFLPGVSP